MIDYYKILNLQADASSEEIKKSYRELAIRFHPDKNPNNLEAEEKFKVILEAYTILFDPVKRAKYDNLKSKKNQNYAKPLNSEEIYNSFVILRNKIIKLNKSNTNQFSVQNAILTILTNENIELLLKNENKELNIKIINLCKDCFPVMKFYSVNLISPTLIKLANNDKKTTTSIKQYLTYRRLIFYFEKYIGLVFIVSLVIMLIFIFNRDDKNNNSASKTKDGELTNQFSISNEVESKNTFNSEEILRKKKEKLIKEGWSESEIPNGQLPECYNYTPKKSDINNYLKINVGGGTDVAVKLMDYKTNICIRYVFINSGSSFSIRNIPESKYYLKLAYGKEWISKIENRKCKGKFLRNAIYEKSIEIMDFRLKETSDGYQFSNYELELDMISSNAIQSFNSADITEDKFNE